MAAGEAGGGVGDGGGGAIEGGALFSAKLPDARAKQVARLTTTNRQRRWPNFFMSGDAIWLPRSTTPPPA